jgi:hypothetical protein
VNGPRPSLRTPLKHGDRRQAGRRVQPSGGFMRPALPPGGILGGDGDPVEFRDTNLCGVPPGAPGLNSKFKMQNSNIACDRATRPTYLNFAF